MAYLVLNPRVRLRVTDEALYTGQHELTIPWNCISEVFAWGSNLNTSVKMLLTKSGETRQRFKGRSDRRDAAGKWLEEIRSFGRQGTLQGLRRGNSNAIVEFLVGEIHVAETYRQLARRATQDSQSRPHSTY